MGLMNFIRHNLPEPWDKASTELKMKTELIHRLHSVVPRAFKNKHHYKEGMAYIRRLFRSDANIIYLVDATNMDIEKWQNLSLRINELKYLCE